MIIYRVGQGKVILNVTHPDEPAIIEIENKNQDPLLNNLKKDFENGWMGMHGNRNFLETTAIDLNHAASYHLFFNYLNPILIEGQEILNTWKRNKNVYY